MEEPSGAFPLALMPAAKTERERERERERRVTATHCPGEGGGGRPNAALKKGLLIKALKKG